MIIMIMIISGAGRLEIAMELGCSCRPAEVCFSQTNTLALLISSAVAVVWPAAA